MELKNGQGGLELRLDERERKILREAQRLAVKLIELRESGVRIPLALTHERTEAT